MTCKFCLSLGNPGDRARRTHERAVTCEFCLSLYISFFHVTFIFKRLKFQNRKFTSVCDVRLSFRAKWLHQKFQNRNFKPVSDAQPSFRAKGLQLTQNCNFTSGLRYFLVTLYTAILHQLFALGPSFRAKVLHLNFQNCNSTPVFGIWPSCHTKGQCSATENSHFHTPLCVQHTRSPQRVAQGRTELDFHRLGTFAVQNYDFGTSDVTFSHDFCV